MSTNFITTNILGSKRFKSSNNQNTNIQLEVEEKTKPITEDKVIDIVNQYQIFLNEREKSKKYRINGRFNLYTSNALSSNSAAYVDGKYSDAAWSPIFYGNPQPVAPNNWVMQITYPSDSLPDYVISSRKSIPVVSEAYRGLQYQFLNTTTIDGSDYLTLFGVQNHNLQAGDSIYIFSYNSYNPLQGIYRVKNVGINGENLKTDLTLDIIVDPNLVPNTNGNFLRVVDSSVNEDSFNNILFVTATDMSGNTLGNYTTNEVRYATIKTQQNHNLLVNDFVEIIIASQSALNGLWRIYNVISPTEFVIRLNMYVNKGTVLTPTPTPQYRYFKGTPSEYYVRLFEVLTTNDYEVYPCAFSTNIYPDVIDHTIGTANNTWLFHFNEDINVERLKTNRNAEVSDLFYTIIKRAGANPYGWSTVTSDWDFNYETTNTVNGLELISVFTPGNIGTLEKVNGREEFINPNGEINATHGDKYIGDFVEFNSKEIKETIISEVIHRFGMAVPTPILQTPNVDGQGYYYKPFRRLEVRKYSNVIETAESDQNIIGLPPDYITYSDKTIAWRDLLTVGYFEENNNGVDYPFVNGAHYYYFNHNLFIKLQPGPYSTANALRQGSFIDPNSIPQEC
jgi:hypothetical protein